MLTLPICRIICSVLSLFILLLYNLLIPSLKFMCISWMLCSWCRWVTFHLGWTSILLVVRCCSNLLYDRLCGWLIEISWRLCITVILSFYLHLSLILFCNLISRATLTLISLFISNSDMLLRFRLVKLIQMLLKLMLVWISLVLWGIISGLSEILLISLIHFSELIYNFKL